MPVRRHLVLPVVVLLGSAAGAVAGCGGSGGSGKAAAPRPLGAPGSDPAASALVAKAAAAIGKVHSYHSSGVAVDADGRSRLTADVSDDGRLRARLVNGKGSFAVIVVGSNSYVKADRTYWLSGSSGSATSRLTADLFANHWVRLPLSAAPPYLDLLKDILPKTAAYCFPKKLGKLTVDGTRTFRGKKVTVVKDDGNVPGGAPSELWVAATGRALPARTFGHGPTRPGGTFDPRCDVADDTTKRSATTLGRYNHIAPIVAPPHPIDPTRLRHGAPGGLSA